MIEYLGDKGLGVGFVCRVLGLSGSAYYARKKRPKPARRLRDEQLMPLIEQVHAESGGTYGVRRITRALRRKGVQVARRTAEGKTKREIIRCLKRYVIREVYHLLQPAPRAASAAS